MTVPDPLKLDQFRYPAQATQTYEASPTASESHNRKLDQDLKLDHPVWDVKIPFILTTKQKYTLCCNTLLDIYRERQIDLIISIYMKI